MKTFNCIIISSESDYHACAIRHAIKSLGKNCEIIETTELIHKLIPDLHIGIDDNGIEVKGGPFSLASKHVWARRLFYNKNISSVSQSFQGYVYNESIEFEKNTIRLLERDSNVRWLNRASSVQLAEVKAYQLHMASNSGLRIPRTLISASPNVIRGFCQSFDRIVVKPFNPHTWHDESKGKRLVLFANTIHQRQIEDFSDAELAKSPCIYQDYIPTKSDVRVGIIDKTAFALEMRHNTEGKIDFRCMDKEDLSYQRIPIPNDVYNNLLLLMKNLDVNIASADFIIDKHGRWNFIELNPSGAFLFMQERCSDIPMLSATASTLLFGEIVPDHENIFPSLADFIGSRDHSKWLSHKEEFDARNKFSRHITYLDNKPQDAHQ